MNQQGAHRYEDRLLEFAYGELPAAEARSIEAHVKGCSRCTGALREIEGVRRQMSQLAPEPAPDAGLDSLLAYAEQSARRAAAGPAPAGGGWRRWLFAAVGTASLAAVLVVVGVVANRPELAPVSPAAIQKEEAKAQAQMRDQSAAATPPPPAAPTGATAAAAQPLAEGQAQDLEQGREKNKDADKLVKDAVAANEAPPPPEAKVGRAVGKKEYDVQRVDVSSGVKSDEKKPLDPRLRESGNDRPDTMQNMVVGKGTRPVLPTTGTQGYAQKTPPAADGEMVFPDTKTGHAAAPAPAKPAPSYRKMAPAPTAAKKKAPVALGESGGIGTGRYGEGGGGSTSPAGPSRGKSGGKDDDSFDSLFGSSGGSKSSAGATRGGGTVRPSAPATSPVQAAAPGPAARTQQEAEVQAKQRAAQQAEATRQEELLKMERAKAARMELERSAESPAQRDRAPEPTPAPAGAPAPMAQAPSRSRSATKSVAMNAPPPPVPAREVAAPSEAEDEAALAQAPSASIPLSSSAPSSRKADVPPPSKVRTVNAQELFLAATRARPGSPEEINGLIIAINAGLSGQYRIDALQRLCTQLDASGDSRAYDYCSAWSSADPNSAVAMKRAREADDRWGPRARAKAAKKASEPAKAVDEAKPASAY